MDFIMVKTCTLTPTVTSNLTLHWTLTRSYHFTKMHCSSSYNCRKNSFSDYMWRVQRILTINNPCCTGLELEFCVKKFVIRHLENSFDSGVCENTFVFKKSTGENNRYLDKSPRKIYERNSFSAEWNVAQQFVTGTSHSGVSSTSLPTALARSWIGKDGAQPDQGAQLPWKNIDAHFRSSEDWTYKLRHERHLLLPLRHYIEALWLIVKNLEWLNVLLEIFSPPNNQ